MSWLNGRTGDNHATHIVGLAKFPGEGSDLLRGKGDVQAAAGATVKDQINLVEFGENTRGVVVKFVLVQFKVFEVILHARKGEESGSRKSIDELASGQRLLPGEGGAGCRIGSQHVVFWLRDCG